MRCSSRPVSSAVACDRFNSRVVRSPVYEVMYSQSCVIRAAAFSAFAMSSRLAAILRSALIRSFLKMACSFSNCIILLSSFVFSNRSVFPDRRATNSAKFMPLSSSIVSSSIRRTAIVPLLIWLMNICLFFNRLNL